MSTATAHAAWKPLVGFLAIGGVLAGGISAAVFVPSAGSTKQTTVKSSPAPETQVLGEQASKPTPAPAPAAKPTAPNPNVGNPGNGNPPANPGHPISVTWTIDKQLKPGLAATLNAVVTNTNNQDILVTSVTAVVTGVDKNGCDTAWVDVTNFSSAGTRVSKNSAGVFGLPIQLKDLPATNQDACKSAAFNITVTAQARQA